MLLTLWHTDTTTAFLREGLVPASFVIVQRDQPLISRSKSGEAALSDNRHQRSILDDSALLMAGKQTSTRHSTVKQKHYRRPRSIALIPLDEEEDVMEGEEEIAPVLSKRTNTTMDDQVVSVIENMYVHEQAKSPVDSPQIENLSSNPENVVEVIPETTVEAIVDDEISINENSNIISTAGVQVDSTGVDWPAAESWNSSIDAPSILDDEVPYFAKSVETVTMDETIEEIRSTISPVDQNDVDKVHNTPKPDKVVRADGLMKDIHSKFSNSDETYVAQTQNIAETPVVDKVVAVVSPVKEKEYVVDVSETEQKEAGEGGGVEASLVPVPPKQIPPISLLPRREWDANVICAQAFAAVDQHPILLFDGACNLCNGWVNFCLDYDVKANFRFASLQSKVGQAILIRDGRPPDERSDIILATPQETFSKSDAVLRVVSQLEGLPILLRVAATITQFFFPPWLRNAAYKFVSVNKHIFGDTDGPVCRLDLDGEYFGRFIEDPELELYYDNLASESEEEVYVQRR